MVGCRPLNCYHNTLIYRIYFKVHFPTCPQKHPQKLRLPLIFAVNLLYHNTAIKSKLMLW
jgi:hypothetical protein